MAVAKRFADVFDFAYARFLELQEKEERNRELEIENALERVRAQALGMQESGDLNSVTAVLHEQIISLGIQTIVTGIDVVDRENESIQNSAVVDRSGPSPWKTIPFETYKTIPFHVRLLEAYERGDTAFHGRQEGEEYQAYLKYYLDHMSVSNPEAQDRDWPDHQNASMVFFSRGWIYLKLPYSVGESGEPVFDGDPLSEDDLAMVKRFADMFDFAYSRFLELQEKEERDRNFRKRTRN